MKVKSVVAAVALLVSGASSFAGGPLGTLDDVGKSFQGSVAGAGVFFDTFTFSLSSLSDVMGGAFSSPKVLGVGVELAMGSTVIGSDGNVMNGFSFTGLAAGNYSLKFAGYSTGAGSFGGNVSAVAAPVPEPETYAMMLAGLAAVGFLARRRQNA